MDLALAGKVAVVTGASKGIGLAATRALVDEGAAVVAGARSVTGLEGIEGVTSVAVDLAAPDGPSQLVERAIEIHGRVDVLVNNVGAVRIRTGGFLGTSDDEFAWSMNLNFFAGLRTTRAAIVHMLEQGGGAIVNVASINSFYQPDAGTIDYGAAKAAVVNFSKSIAQESETIAAATGTDADTARAGVLAAIATGRFTPPEEVARADRDAGLRPPRQRHREQLRDRRRHGQERLTRRERRRSLHYDTSALIASSSCSSSASSRPPAISRTSSVWSISLLRERADALPAVQHDEAVADGVGVVRVVRDEDDAHAALARLQDVLQDDARLLHSEGRGRLVEDQHARAEVDRPRDRHRLPLAARERADGLVGVADVDAHLRVARSARPPAPSRCRTPGTARAPSSARRRGRSSARSTSAAPSRDPGTPSRFRDRAHRAAS